MRKGDSIFVAGHNGLVGSSILRLLKNRGYTNILTQERKDLDLRNQKAVLDFFDKEKPKFVILAAAKVGGILANDTYPAEFIYDNIMIQSNIIDSAYKASTEKLLFLGSSCIYPKYSDQPIKEEYLLTGLLEPTNEAYAIAKIAGIKMCQFYNKQYGTNFISAMPTNLYGPNDNFDLETSHVLPALIRKIHEANESKSSFVELWGTGSAKREFLYIDDLADACLFLLNNYSSSELINVGVGKDISIKELASLIKEIIGYEGKITYDKTKPDGTPQKVLDTSKINNLGWLAKTSLKEGIKKTYEWYLKNG